MKKIILTFMIFTLICSFSYAKNKTFKQQTIECIKTNENIIIDGQLDDAWLKTKPTYMFVVSTKKAPFSTGQVRAMYDNENLYIFLKAKDKDLVAYETEPDGITCNDDVLEIFLRPGVNCPWYYNAEINALGTAYTGKNHVGGGGLLYRWRTMWNPTLDYAVFLKGTLNNYKDIDEYWALEVKIPFKELDELNGKTPKPNDVWTCNFAKYDYSIYLPADISGMELSSVCHTNEVNFHELQNYCPFIFK